MPARTWFITGASRGFGRQWAIAALERGDSVAATARRTETLDDLAKRFGDRLLPLQLDVTDHGQATSRRLCAPTTFRAAGRRRPTTPATGSSGWSRSHRGGRSRAQFERTSSARSGWPRAALPFMRDQGSGHFIPVSSVGGVLAFRNIGMYNASKWAVEAFRRGARPGEVAQPPASRSRIIEPDSTRTDWGGASAHPSPRRCPPTRGVGRRPSPRARALAHPGDPAASARRCWRSWTTDDPPLRIFFGEGAVAIAAAAYEARMANWRKWEPVSITAQGEKVGA